MGRQVWLRVGLALALFAGVIGLKAARRRFVASFFVRGPGGEAAPDLPGPTGPLAPLAPAARVRVVLLDGLGLAPARALPALSALCESGLDLEVDVGFPTVSLPVQAALWSGLTQQQSGIQYVAARLPAPLDGVPARVPGSLALAESHAFIVESVGFAATRPRPDETGGDDARRTWEATGFSDAAALAVATATPLVFVHVLRIDDAGHRHGGGSPEYAAAARWADALVARLHAAAPDARWLILADHGHTAVGGHAGAEPAIRIVRGCLAGGLDRTALPGGRALHLVDLSRALADSLGVTLPAGAAGRPLAAALAAPPSVGATLPHPGATRLALGGALILGALLATLFAARWRPWLLPWWAPIAYLALVASEGVPSLSSKLVYAPLGQAVYLGGLPGLVVLALVAGATTAGSPVRLVITQLALPLAALGAARLACAGSPPLMPGWTAHTSIGLVFCLSAALVVGLALLAGLVPGWFGRSRAPETRRGPP